MNIDCTNKTHYNKYRKRRSTLRVYLYGHAARKGETPCGYTYMAMRPEKEKHPAGIPIWPCGQKRRNAYVKKTRQVLAILGIVILVGMYVSTLIFALSNHPNSYNMLMASIYCTIIVPVLLYAYMLAYKWFGKNPEIDTVIFDIGNVLADYEWLDVLQDLGYDDETITAVSEAVFLSDDWPEGDRGLLSEARILQAFIDNNPDYETEIREVFAHIGDTIHTFPYADTWLDSLRQKRYRIYILSNFSEPLYKQAADKMTFLSKTNGGYMSYQVGLLKPEPAIYQKLIRNFHIDPKKAVFLDDLPENVAAARLQGLHAIQFTSYEKAVDELKKLGVG